MRANTSLTLRDRHTLTLGGFCGVDLTSDPTQVAPERAIDAVNLIYENGAMRKRKGWRQKALYQIYDSVDRIYSFYQYRNGSHEKLLVHMGTYLIVSNVMMYPIGNTPAQFFQKDGKCYIVTGEEYLVYGSWDEGETYKLNKVSNIAYVPTTTVSIDSFGVEDEEIERLDAVNLLTRRRKNTLVGNFNVQQKWVLDTYIENETDVSVHNTVYLEGTTATETLILYNAVYDRSKDLMASERGDNFQPSAGKTYLYDKRENKVKGYLKWGEYKDAEENGGFLKNENGLICLEYMTSKGTSQAEPNITVEFTAASLSDEDPADKIRGCTFGVLFGVNGGSDRLFLSGNPKYPNTVFYSASDDFTYFPDNQYFSVGDESAAITGFVRVSDGTLAVLKEESDRDAAIFYVTGTQQSFFDDNGELIKSYALFTVSNGGAGEGNLHPHATANLAGDALMLSQNGVFAIVPNENGSVNVRQVKERSYSVNRRLVGEDLSRAVGIVHNNRYYLSVGGNCYVADAAHKYYRSGNDLNQSFNYEWWYWENVPATCWAIIDGSLWFGTSDGRLCAFDTEDFFDTTEHALQYGDLTLDHLDRSRLVYSEKIRKRVSEGDWIRLNPGGPLMAVMAEGIAPVSDVGSWYDTDEESCRRLYEGMTLYAGNYDAGQFLLDSEQVTVTDVDRGSCRFRLDRIPNADSYATGTMDVQEEPFCLFMDLSDRPLLITEVDGDTQRFSLKESPSAEVLRLLIDPYGFESGSFLHHDTVAAHWITPYLNMGSSLYGKTLLRLSVTAAEGSGGFLFGYETKRASGQYDLQGIHTFDWESFSLERMSFDNSFAGSYTLRAMARGFNFIRFCFRSEQAEDMIPTQLSALYKITKMNRGVR